MRFPSHMPTRVSRAVALRAALGAVLTALVLVPAAGAAPGDRGVFVSKGVGRQIFAGGGGLTYGTLFSGGTLVVLDYSEAQDLKVESAVPPTTNPDGSLTYVPAGGTNRMIFRITGTLYTVKLFGSALYNGIGVYGRLQLRGGGPKATLVVNGKKLRWGPPANKLGRVPRVLADLYELAAKGLPVPVPPAPPEPPPPVTTTGTSPADTVRTDGS